MVLEIKINIFRAIISQMTDFTFFTVSLLVIAEKAFSQNDDFY